MAIRYVFIFFVWISICLYSPHCTSQTLKIEYDSSRAYIQKGDFAGALPWLEKAKISALSNPKDTNGYVEVLKLLAVSYARTNNLAAAEAAFIEVDNLYSQMGYKQAYRVITLQNFGIFYYNQKKYKEAEIIFARAYQIKVVLVGRQNIEALNLLSSLASTKLLLKKYPEAEIDYKELVAQRALLLGESHPDYLAALTSLATVYKMLNKTSEAIDISLKISEAIKIIKGENSIEYAQSLSNLASYYKSSAQYENAEKYYQLAIQVYEKTDRVKSTAYALTLVDLAGVYRYLGRYEFAEPLFFKAQIVIKESSGESSPEFAYALNNIGLFFYETGKYDLAEINFKQSIDISNKTLGERHPETATTLNNIGLLYRSMGRYAQAEPILKKTLKIRKDVLGNKNLEYASSLNNLASLYESMGRFEQAEPLYKQSLEISKAISGIDNSEYATTCNNLAGVYESLNKYEQAELLYNQALQTIQKILGSGHPDYTATLNNLALLQESQGKKDLALITYKQNLNATRITLGEKHPNYATSLNNYAVLLGKMGKYSDAETNFLQVLLIRKEILEENHPAYTTTLYEMAKLYSCMKNYTQADLYWEKAIKNYLFQIDNYFPNMSEKERSKFYALVSPKFEQYQSYCLLRSKSSPEKLAVMYNNQLATKALLFSSANKMRQRVLVSGDQTLIQNFKNWNYQKEILAKAFTMSKSELKAQGINIEELTNSTNELEKDLNQSSEIFRNAYDNQKITWKDVQKKLKPNEAAIEVIRFVKFKFDSSGYYQTDSIYYLALIILPTTKNNPDLVLLTNGHELENKFIKYYRNAIKFKTDDDISYGQYWEKIKQRLAGISNVYFSPDGVYNQLNMNTLRNNQTKKYVLDEIEIKIVSNTKDLLAESPRENTIKQISLIGSPDFTFNIRNLNVSNANITAESAAFIERSSAGIITPLPATKIEVEQIGGYLNTNNWKTNIFTEQNATEEILKKQSNPKILHIATHGFFESNVNLSKNNKKDKEDDVIENPLLRSGLLLAGSSLTLLKRTNENINIDLLNDKSKEDGILTAYEAMNLNLEKTDLVVLSACETGLGEVINGEGVYGLQRAFSVAGAKTIIISLWTVNDEATQKLMIEFYRQLIVTNNKTLAFKNAQKQLRSQMPDPYFWGAFVMIGE